MDLNQVRYFTIYIPDMTEKEFDDLCKLACIAIDPDQKAKFMQDVSSITTLLDQISKFKKDFPDQIKISDSHQYMHTNSGLDNFDNTDGILQNVEHPLSARSVVIQSFVHKD